jgi:hypothetical protein
LRWLPARAHDNGIFLAFSNGVGIDDDEIRTGNAMLVDPYGRIIAETGRAGVDLVAADLDPGLFKQNTGRRWIRTRRPELYGPLVERTGREEDMRNALREEKKFEGGGFLRERPQRAPSRHQEGDRVREAALVSGFIEGGDRDVPRPRLGDLDLRLIGGHRGERPTEASFGRRHVDPVTSE